MAEESDGTLRNLPPGKMKDIRQMFEGDDDNSKKEVTPTLRKKVKPPTPVSRPMTSALSVQNDVHEEKDRPRSETNMKPPQHKPRKPSIVSETIKQLEDQVGTAKENGDNNKMPQSEKGTPTKKLRIKKEKMKPKVKSKSETVKDGDHSGQSGVSTGTESETKNQTYVAPPPPKKPPRTHAHEEYLMIKDKMLATAKTERTKQDGKKEVTENENAKPNKEKAPKNLDSDGKADKASKPLRPVRPQGIGDGPLYEAIAPHDNLKLDSGNTKNVPGPDLILDHRAESTEFDQTEIQHWDLPRDMIRFPMRRSLSAECVYGESSLSGDPVYIDPTEAIGYHDDSDVYIDSAGYAVPHKHRRVQHMQSYDSSVGCIRVEKGLKAKLGELRKLFFHEIPVKPRPAEPSTPKTNKRKIHQQVKQKINQAFAVLNKYVRRPSESQVDDLEGADDLSSDSDSFVDLGEIDKRVQYCTMVKKQTYASIHGARAKWDLIYPQLFDYALIVGLEAKSGNNEYEPYVIHKFPEVATSNVSIPNFCFPDASSFTTTCTYLTNPSSEVYSFVLTNFDGVRIYGYCKRILPPDSTNGLPEVLCIISPVDAFNMFNTLLDEIEKKRLISINEAQELIAASFGRPLPSPGKVVHIRIVNNDGIMETLFLRRSGDRRLETVNCEYLPQILGVDKLIKVFSCILLERSVLFCASQLSTLSHTIQALVALLYPFSWQHTFIPVLPEQMLDVCCSPIPYIIGILSCHLPQVQKLPMEDVVIVDLDNKELLRSIGDEGTIIPKKYQKALKTALNMCKLDADARSSQNLMVSEAFLRFFVEAVSHFGEYFTVQQDGKKVFMKEVFYQTVSSRSLQQFLRWFVETQMFEVFTSDYSVHSNIETLELFEMRLAEYKDLLAERRTGIGQKMKNLGKAIKTKLT
ncbi:hypothetical protein ScPMuIL_015354 [Solemya velum]